MNTPNKTQTAEEAVVQILRATRAADADAGQARHSQQTDQCPNVARFAAVYKHGAKWTAAENEHVAECPFCQKLLNMFATAASKASQMETVSDVKAKAKDETHRDVKPKKPGPDDRPKPP